MNQKRLAELYLTTGRICKWLGAALSFPMIFLALPGLALLIAGMELWRQGEDSWNEVHRLPKRVQEGSFR